MATEAERREVARRLIEEAMHGTLRGSSEHRKLCEALGCRGSSWRRMFMRLAELIGPGGEEGGGRR